LPSLLLTDYWWSRTIGRQAMSDNGSAMKGGTVNVAGLERELRRAIAALDEPGAGARGNLECRVADLQERVLATPARTLLDVEARLVIMRDVVASLGQPGYLLQLIDATLADVRSMAAAGG
jgi:hypothetical protein